MQVYSIFSIRNKHESEKPVPNFSFCYLGFTSRVANRNRAIKLWNKYRFLKRRWRNELNTFFNLQVSTKKRISFPTRLYAAAARKAWTAEAWARNTEAWENEKDWRRKEEKGGRNEYEETRRKTEGRIQVQSIMKILFLTAC